MKSDGPAWGHIVWESTHGLVTGVEQLAAAARATNVADKTRSAAGTRMLSAPTYSGARRVKRT
jgi:hypothetical protein